MPNVVVAVALGVGVLLFIGFCVWLSRRPGFRRDPMAGYGGDSGLDLYLLGAGKRPEHNSSHSDGPDSDGGWDGGGGDGGGGGD